MHFAIHVKAWWTWSYYRSMQYRYHIHCWMEVSGEFDTPAALPPKQEQPLLLDSLLVWSQGRLVNFGKGTNFSAYRESKHDCSVVQPVPKSL